MKIKILFLFTFFVLSGLRAQNLYDLEHSKKFADYLVKTRQFDLGAIEYERLSFLEPNNDTLKIALINCYSFNKKYDLAIVRMNKFVDNPLNLDSTFSDLYSFNLLANKEFDASEAYIQQSLNLSKNKKEFYKGFSYLLLDEFKKANDYSTPLLSSNELLKPIVLLSSEAMLAKHKSPVLAAIFSTIVPGTGKMYTGDWADAVISIITFGFAGYQTYRSFDLKGFDKPRGYIFGTVAAGFYLGNIYGSYKSAQRYNKRSLKKVHEKIENAFYGNP
jgi:tetratricopeptide (TPR) repeat protein